MSSPSSGRRAARRPLMTLVLDPPRPVTAPKLKLALERREDAAAVDRLVDAAFGPGRFAKTAERLREGNRARYDLSWCAWAGERLIGAVRTWPVGVGDAPPRAAMFLGPIAVSAESRRRGLGALLVERVCEAALQAGDGVVLLVGDRAFFEPLGFEPVAPGRLQLPGPVDSARILWRPMRPGALDGVEGEVRTPALSPHARLRVAS